MIKPTLANTYIFDNKKDYTGWLISEKYDGMRVLFDNGKFYSRNDIVLNLPEKFKSFIPKIKNYVLDGEIWFGYQSFDRTGVLRKQKITYEELKDAKYLVFDIFVKNKKNLTYRERYKILKTLKKNKHFNIVSQTVLKQPQIDIDVLYKISDNKGEGLMLRNPESKYICKRTSNLLKVKLMDENKGKIIGFKNGRGKYENKIGALKVEAEINGKNMTFYIGSGLNDEIRKVDRDSLLNKKISYKFFGLTKNNIPRFPILTEILK